MQKSDKIMLNVGIKNKEMINLHKIGLRLNITRWEISLNNQFKFPLSDIYSN